MFEKSKTFKQLSTHLEENNFGAFRAVYEGSSFDIVHYRPFWGGTSVRDLIADAMHDNKKEFADFLTDKVGLDKTHDIHAGYKDKNDGRFYRESMLYMAINNDREYLALRLINTPGINLKHGKDIGTEEYDVTTKTMEYEWGEVESLFDLAGRKGNRKIIETLYDKQIGQLNQKAETIEQSSIFFPKSRAAGIQEDITALKQARDKLLRPPKNIP